MKIEPIAFSPFGPVGHDTGSNAKKHNIVSPKASARGSEWARWTRLVRQVEIGSPTAESELCRNLTEVLLLYFRRQRRTVDFEDLAHDSLLMVLRAIRKKELREPARLMGFVYIVARRTLWAALRRSQRQYPGGSEALNDTLPDKAANPEFAILEHERNAMVREGLQALPELDRNILTRFYFLQQSPEAICRELSLTENQFRLRKCRAKARLVGLCNGSHGRRYSNDAGTRHASLTLLPLSPSRPTMSAKHR